MRKQSKSQSAKSTKCPVRSPKSPSFRSPTPNRWTADHRHPRSSYPPHHTESPCSTNCTFPRPNTSADWLRFIPIQRIRTVQFPQNPKNVLDVLIIRNQQRKLQRHQSTNNYFFPFLHFRFVRNHLIRIHAKQHIQLLQNRVERVSLYASFCFSKARYFLRSPLRKAD